MSHSSALSEACRDVKNSKGERTAHFAAALAFAALIAAAACAVLWQTPIVGATSGRLDKMAAATNNSISIDHNRIAGGFASLPLAFEPNQGQTDPAVRYLARGHGYSLFLNSNAAYFVFPIARPARVGRTSPAGENILSTDADAVQSIEMQMLGANRNPLVTAESLLPGVTNYMRGQDAHKWQTGVKHYAQVRYANVYGGIDMAFHGARDGGGTIEFDFVIHPRANPETVQLAFSGLKALRTTDSGDLILTSAGGDLRLHRPLAYQETRGIRTLVNASFVVGSANRVSFRVGDYDRSREVVIDPTISYSTYLGGSLEDDANAIAVDTSGNAYVTGKTDSTNFPAPAGGVTPLGPVGSFDVFVTELNSSGALVFTTLIGGSADDIGNAIAVDSTGIYVAGETSSGGATAFPTTSGTVQPTYLTAGSNHGFVSKLALTGSSLVWSTFVEGSSADNVFGLAIVHDANTPTDDDVYVVGSTDSIDLGSNSGANGTVNPLPATSHWGGGASLNNGAGQTGNTPDGFVAKIGVGGIGPYLFLSYLGGSNVDSAQGVALDGSGNVYIAGLTDSTDFPATTGVLQPTCGTDGQCNASGGNVFDDAFVTAITSSNTPSFIYSTYIGGENTDDAFAIAVDAAGNAYVTGQTLSTKFPMQNPLSGGTALSGTQDAFISAVNPTGTALNYSTYLGGSGAEAGDGIAVDSADNAYVTGYTTSNNFPTAAAVQSSFGGGNSDAFVSELTFSGGSLSLPFSTYLGGSGDEDFVFGALAIDSHSNVYATGNTNSSNFPVLNAADRTYGGGGNCPPTGGVPCPDAFVTVYTNLNQDFTITGSQLAAVSPGSSSTATITIAPVNGYSNTVNLTCSVSGSGTPLPTCSFSANSISGGSGTSTLTVKTTGPSALLLPFLPSGHWGTQAYAVLIPLASLPFGVMLMTGPLPGAARRARKLFGLLFFGILISGLLFLAACGGGNSGGGNNGGGGGSQGTPAGTYTVTVTGTDATATALTHSVTPALTLTVN